MACYCFGLAKPNARFQARQKAGARNERRLEGVACKPLLGKALAPQTRKTGTVSLRGPGLQALRLENGNGGRRREELDQLLGGTGIFDGGADARGEHDIVLHLCWERTDEF